MYFSDSYSIKNSSCLHFIEGYPFQSNEFHGKIAP